MYFLLGFKNAFKGIYVSIKSGHNLRLQFVAGAYCMMLAPFFAKSRSEWAILILTISSVLALEVVNTALERMCDIIEPSFNKIIKAAKDMAAGAVLICSVASIAVAGLIFFRWDSLQQLLEFCRQERWYPLLLGILMIPSAIFMKNGKKCRNTKF
ncbi:MAG: hypothetical protein BGN88_10895, partial [Clostridiales bacterium 43-6]